MKNIYVLNQLRKIVGNPEYVPKDPTEICHHILHTVYLGVGTEDPSSKARSEAIAKQIGADHRSCDFSKVFQAFKDWIPKNLPFNPRSAKDGGNIKEDLILTNLAARLKMTLTYMVAQLIPMKPEAGCESLRSKFL